MKSYILCGLFFAASVFGGESETSACDSLYQEWKTNLGKYREKCILESDMEGMAKELHINCNSHQCIEDTIELHLQFQDNFIGMCSMDNGNNENFKVDDSDKVEIEKYVSMLSECNKCIVNYSEFTKLKEDAMDRDCFPHDDHGHASCGDFCLGYKQSYISMYYELVEKHCHQYMPGGCGAEGGMTEGDVYDALISMQSEIETIRSSILICDATCGPVLQKWYSGWKGLAVDGCIASDKIDFATQDPSLTSFQISSSCTKECRNLVSESLKETYAISPECKKEGLISTHISLLTNSISDKSCDKVSTNTLESTAAKGFFTLSILVVGVSAVYFLVKCCKNRTKKAQDTQTTVWKQGLPKTEMRNLNNDESVLIYGDDDDDEI